MYQTYEIQVEPVIRDRRITQHAFRTRVGDTLVATMEVGALDNPNASAAVRLELAKERARQARVYSAGHLDLDDQELRAGFAGVPTEDFDRIFTAPVLDSERA